MVDVDFCNIYLKKSINKKISLIEGNLISYLNIFFVYPVYCCSHYTNIVSNMIQASSLDIWVNLRKKILINKCFYGGGSIQFYLC